MTHDFTIQLEKLAQAPDLLKQHHLDVWLTFVRETPQTPDPALGLILGLDMTWLSAFLVAQNGKKIAIVGRFDADNVQRMGGYDEVIGYDADIFPDLKAALDRLNPTTIAINYSESDTAADGLSYGLWRLLNTSLANTPYKHRLVSAEPLIGSLRGCKTSSEIERIRTAIRTTEEIIAAVTQFLKPGQGEEDVYQFVREQFKARGVVPAWDNCPTVTAGPDSPYGHTLPSNNYKTAAGQLVHMDLGVLQNDYTSDLQRVWYLKKPDEDSIPEPVQKGFNAVHGAILAAADVLKPGIEAWKVDETARKALVAQGYPEYQHATGHHIGRSVHDGAAVLGPRWPRYGKTVEGKVETGNVFTLELGVHVPEYGFIGLEEDVLVTESGTEWLSKPQTEIMVIKV